jgi:hypothetical protein
VHCRDDARANLSHHICWNHIREHAETNATNPLDDFLSRMNWLQQLAPGATLRS